jgi:hypothetical protein
MTRFTPEELAYFRRVRKAQDLVTDGFFGIDVNLGRLHSIASMEAFARLSPDDDETRDLADDCLWVNSDKIPAIQSALVKLRTEGQFAIYMALLGDWIKPEGFAAYLASKADVLARPKVKAHTEVQAPEACDDANRSQG